MGGARAGPRPPTVPRGLPHLGRHRNLTPGTLGAWPQTPVKQKPAHNSRASLINIHSQKKSIISQSKKNPSQPLPRQPKNLH